MISESLEKNLLDALDKATQSKTEDRLTTLKVAVQNILTEAIGTDNDGLALNGADAEAIAKSARDVLEKYSQQANLGHTTDEMNAFEKGITAFERSQSTWLDRQSFPRSGWAASV